MEKNIFRGMTIKEQVSYINLRMKKGETLTDACKSVGMTKELSRKFKRANYELLEGQFIPSNQATQPQEVAVDTITLPKIKTAKKPKMGRPLRVEEYSKLTLEIEKSLKKRLKVYCAENEIRMNEYITKLLLENLK